MRLSFSLSVLKIFMPKKPIKKIKNTLPLKVQAYIQDKYYKKSKYVIKTKPVDLQKVHFDNGLLTPNEYDILNTKGKKQYLKNIVKSTDKMAYYIINGSPSRSKYNKLRPTANVLKEWNDKREKEKKFELERKTTHWQPLTDAECDLIFRQYIRSNPIGRRGYFGDWLDSLVWLGKPLSQSNKSRVNTWRMNNSGVRVDYKPVKFTDNTVKPLEILKKQREQLGEQVKKLLGREQQVIDSLRANFDVLKASVSSDSKADIQLELKENKVPLNYRPANTVATQHGLNSFKIRNKIKSNVEIAETYLKQLKSGKLDYYVNSYQNTVALAEAVGMIPQEMFKTLCYQIVKRKSHFKKEEFLNTGNAVAELVEMYETRRKRMERQFDLKLSIRKFYASKDRKDWSKKYNWDWKNHARFNEEFPKWVKIMTSVAKPKK